MTTFTRNNALEHPDLAVPYFVGAAQAALLDPRSGTASRRREASDALDALMPYIAAVIELGRRHPDELAQLMAWTIDLERPVTR
jgi:hypothetical protein